MAVTLMAAALAQQARSAKYSSETIPASGGDISVTPINHAMMMLQFGDKVIGVDPTGQGDYTDLPKADLILITDIHPDHMDRASIDKWKKSSTVIVAPAAVAKTITEAQVINNGEKKTIAGVEIEAVPMYNMERGPEPGKKFHDKGRGNGYILTLGGKRIYISGDTEAIPEIKALKNIDVAFVCMNLPYTMTAQEAADAVKAFKPKIVYPYHSRNTNTEEFAAALKGTSIDVRLRNWY
ncbi:MAG: MBL fold metallo-hydrolase [Acidobacteria bacterium]|nr:MBL fold metallo-hydrolase [Acidobacteriota bacterium]